ncbi:MAG: hypothetical protein KDA58_00010 [Planctomycetaceae bacterium]|nr:hypothetical protein [Planctomycetaceae bacterium]
MAAAPDQMTLREKLSEAERLTRELIHHVEHGFIPKAHQLRRITRYKSGDDEHSDITDHTVRSTAEKVLESDQFTRQVCEQLNGVLKSVQADVERLQGR